MKHLGIPLLCSLLFVLVASVAYAADFTILPTVGISNIQEEISVNIRIDTAGETINAAQTKLKFNPSILEVKSFSKEGSIFSFWLQEPEFSNTDGIIEFIAGTTNGVSGSSLQVLQITFITKGIGLSYISFINSAITAADGSGTNIFSKANGAQFTVASTVIAPTSVPGLPNTGHIPIPTPIQIIRKPIPAADLPAIPIVNVPLYPNPANWYNFVSQFTPSWKLPPDISGLSTALNANPNFVVPPVSEGLFESRILHEINKDGIYYFHVRFQNNKGWGPTAHYRVRIDTQPPLPFKLSTKTGFSSDNPSPVTSFKAEDALSGIDHYIVKANGEESVTISPFGEEGDVKITNRLEIIQTSIGYVNVRDNPSTSGKLVTRVNPGESFEFKKQENGWYQIMGLPAEALAKEGWVIGTYVRLLNGAVSVATESELEYKMTTHEPGTYIISVWAVDKAGNRIEDKVKIEILPIEMPVITSITQKIIIGSDSLLVIKGTAIADTNVTVTFEDKNRFIILQNETKTNPQGEWKFSLDKDLKRGDYFVSAKAKDSRGASSLSTELVKVQFIDKPIITLFGWDVTFRDLVIILIVTGVLTAIWFYRKTWLHLAKSQRESTIINRDIKNAFNTVKEDLGKIAGIVKKKSSAKTKELEINTVNKKIKDTLDNVEKYSSEDIEKLK